MVILARYRAILSMLISGRRCDTHGQGPLGTKYLVLGTKYLVLGTKYQVLGTKYQVLGTKWPLAVGVATPSRNQHAQNGAIPGKDYHTGPTAPF